MGVFLDFSYPTRGDSMLLSLSLLACFERIEKDAWPADETGLIDSAGETGGHTGDSNPDTDTDTACVPTDEVCNDLDDDCDGDVDEDATDAGTYYTDADSDGYGDSATATKACTAPDGMIADGTDCDDARADIHPGADETDCADPTDYNCDGSTGYDDADGDLFPACADCNDADSVVNPSMTEICDDLDTDEDCDSVADNDAITATGVVPSGATTFYEDADGDSWGSTSGEWCDLPSGWSIKGEDCDDTDASVNPGATETCATSSDDNCDSSDDDTAPDATSWYPDTDGDLFGAEGAVQMRCTAPAGYIADGTDCDDGNASINPGATETCNGWDDDCDDLIDADDGLECTVDTGDTDTPIDTGDSGDTAKPDTGDTGTPIDTGDSDTSIPVDTGEPIDTGDTSVPADTGDTIFETGIIDTGTGCVPTTEVCDGSDNDCDGDIDNDPADGSAWYADADGDGYGDGDVSTNACSAPAGYVADNDDCDDTDAAVNPAGTELDTVLDEDCDDNPFQDATLTTLSGAVVTIVSSTNGLDNESATFEAGTTGSWIEVADRLGGQSVVDMGPYTYTWATSGGLAGGSYSALTFYVGNSAYAECDEEIQVTASVTSGTDQVLVFTARNMASTSNDIGVYVDGTWLGTATLASGSETLIAAEFTAATATPDIQICTGTVQGGVDGTQFGVFETL